MLAAYTPWQLVAITMACGTLLGLALAWRMCRLEPSAQSAGPSTADLEESYARAIDHLRELHEDSARMDAAYVAREQQRVEGRAAQLLGALKAARARPDADAAPRVAKHRRAPTGIAGWLAARPKLVGGMWGAGLCLVGSFLLATVKEGSAPRPGAPVAAPAEATAGGPGIDKARLAELETQLRANPNDVPALLELAHLLLRAQMLDEARVLNDRALTLDGHNLEGLTHAAVLAAGSGDPTGAQAGLKAVLQKDPGFAEAWFFRGMLSMQAGDNETMRESLSQFVRYAPDGPQKERVRAMLERSAAKP